MDEEIAQQSNHLPPPIYTVVNEAGAEHEKSFTVTVSCKEQILGNGTARRKKDAEQLAAKEAMERIAIEYSATNAEGKISPIF